MTNQLKVPRVVQIMDPLARRLLARGVPMGPNRLLTIRGRKSGQPRRAAVAVVNVDGRRWVVGTFGDVNWVRNLRAAGEAILHERGQPLHVRALELSKPDAAEFFRTELPAYFRSLPRVARRWVPPEILNDPDGSAETRPVFELLPSTWPTGDQCTFT